MVEVSVGNIEQLKGLPNVEFDFGVSSALRTAFSSAASALSGQRGSRSSYRTTGLTDFEGHFSDVFRRNGTTQLDDLDEIADTLRHLDAWIAPERVRVPVKQQPGRGSGQRSCLSIFR